MKLLNIEWKAKTKDLAAAETKLQMLSPVYQGEDLQTDTYFETKMGRLKIREGNIENALIWYERENIAGSKTSKILLYNYQPEVVLREILTITNGIKIEVKKKRRIYFIENVKFHFDEVDFLGTFIEVEAINSSGSANLEKLQKQCIYYANLLGVTEDDYVKNSYSDMLLNL